MITNKKPHKNIEHKPRKQRPPVSTSRENLTRRSAAVGSLPEAWVHVVCIAFAFAFALCHFMSRKPHVQLRGLVISTLFPRTQ